MNTRLRYSRLAAAATGVLVVLAAGAIQAAGATTSPSGSHPSCQTSQLRVWRGDPGDGAAGSFYYELEFSNVSSTTCTFNGFPGVSAVTSNGTQIGAAAARDRRFAPTTVTLAPRQTAHAVLRIVDVANFPSATCGPTTAAALKVFPPNETHAATLPFKFRACSKSSQVYLDVRTIRAHVGIPGYSQ